LTATTQSHIVLFFRDDFLVLFLLVLGFVAVSFFFCFWFFFCFNYYDYLMITIIAKLQHFISIITYFILLLIAYDLKNPKTKKKLLHSLPTKKEPKNHHEKTKQYGIGIGSQIVCSYQVSLISFILLYFKFNRSPQWKPLSNHVLILQHLHQRYHSLHLSILPQSWS